MATVLFTELLKMSMVIRDLFDEFNFYNGGVREIEHSTVLRLYTSLERNAPLRL